MGKLSYAQSRTLADIGSEWGDVEYTFRPTIENLVRRGLIETRYNHIRRGFGRLEARRLPSKGGGEG